MEENILETNEELMSPLVVHGMEVITLEELNKILESYEREDLMDYIRVLAFIRYHYQVKTGERMFASGLSEKIQSKIERS